jgi:hypothetical protein
MKKTCFKCKLTKSLPEFYKHPDMTDGYLGKCKDCAKHDALLHRSQNIDRIREYDRQRGKTKDRIRENTRRAVLRHLANPQQYKAQYLLTNARRDGRIITPDRCSRCGKVGRVHGHHKDYTKPLEVVWLCPVCHKQEHKKPF